jgi:AdoMet-dependent rRNA methyltransferase SPB1
MLKCSEGKNYCKDFQLLNILSVIKFLLFIFSIIIYNHFSAIIGWRRKLKAELYKEDKPKKEESIEMNDEISETDEIDEQIDEEAKDIKRKKRKILKEKRKLNERMNLKMVLKNDQLVDEELELFQLKNIRNKAQLSKVEEIDLSDVDIDLNDNESGDETYTRSNKVVFDKEENRLYDSDDSEDENMDSNSDNEGFGHEENYNESKNSNKSELSDDENDGLVVDLKDKEESKTDKTKMFFENKIFQDQINEDDDDLELELIENKLKQKNSNKLSKHSKSNENNFEKDEYTSSSDEENESKKKKRNNDKVNDKCKKKVKLSAEELALGTLMIKSQKTKRDILDNAWNRYTHEDDEFLPSWFRKDEEKHNKKPLPVTEDMVREYKQQLREINARPIKKVAEAKARKKKKALRKLEKARKRVETVTNAPDMSNKEKAEHIKRLVIF